MSFDVVKTDWYAGVVGHLLDRQNNIHVRGHELARGSGRCIYLIDARLVITVVPYKGRIWEVDQGIMEPVVDTNRFLAI
jgi:hypothetical protein